MASTVTLTDIAKASGVSHVTVSRILHGTVDYRRPTFAKRAARIRKLAREMGYRPNSAARATVRGRFDAVGLLLSTEHSRSILSGTMFNAIAEALAAKGLRLSVDKLPDEKLVDDGAVPDLLRAWSVDGLLINYTTQIPPRLIELVDAYGLPAVWLNSRHEHDCVYPDDEQAGRIATEHLLALGHRKIAFVHYGGWSHYSTPARRDGYARAMIDAGLRPWIITEPDMDAADKRRAAKAWLTGPDRPTAAVVYASPTLWPVYMAAVVDLGLKVPQDLSLISFDHGVIHHADVAVSVAKLPAASLAATAVEMLAQRIADPAKLHPPKVLPCRVVEGNTTAPPGCTALTENR